MLDLSKMQEAYGMIAVDEPRTWVYLVWTDKFSQIRNQKSLKFDPKDGGKRECLG
jgi:hypothetical protein